MRDVPTAGGRPDTDFLEKGDGSLLGGSARPALDTKPTCNHQGCLKNATHCKNHGTETVPEEIVACTDCEQYFTNTAFEYCPLCGDELLGFVSTSSDAAKQHNQ